MRKNPSAISVNPNYQNSFNIKHPYNPAFINRAEFAEILKQLIEAQGENTPKHTGYKIMKHQIGGTVMQAAKVVVDDKVPVKKTETKTRVKGESKTFGDGTDLNVAD